MRLKIRWKCLAMALVIAAAFSLSACGQEKIIPWSTGVNAEHDYDNSLFYSNDFEGIPSTPDPFILYDDGWAYLYFTETGGGILEAYRSQNLANWEYLGVIYERNPSYWGVGRFWAPKVVKNPADGKYYMYTSCSGTGKIGLPEGTSLDSKSDLYASETMDRLHLTVLVSDSPAGPFTEWVGERPNIKKYYHGQEIGTGDTVTYTSGPIFDFANAPAGWETNKEHYANNGTNIFAQLDPYPFFDEDGTFYLYFTRSRDINDALHKQGTWGVRMIDMVTPDYTTLTRLIEPGYMTIGGERSPSSIDDNTVNEGCFMQRHTTVKPDGTEVSKYYLTYSRSGYGDPYYASCLAVADAPLGYPKGSKEAENGGFAKVPPEYGNPIQVINGNYDMFEATGNGMYFTMGDEQFIVSLATASNRTTPNVKSRNFVIDRVVWEYNEDLGWDIPHSNGPTQASLQPAPAVFSGYKDIAGEAAVTAENICDGSQKDNLVNGYVTIHSRDASKEVYFQKEGARITLEFDRPRNIRAVMVYNSHDINYAFSKIDAIVFENKGKKQVIRDIAFPQEYLTAAAEVGALRPGGAAVAEFEEIQAEKITITITGKFMEFEDFLEDYLKIAISNIRVLGE